MGCVSVSQQSSLQCVVRLHGESQMNNGDILDHSTTWNEKSTIGSAIVKGCNELLQLLLHFHVREEFKRRRRVCGGI